MNFTDYKPINSALAQIINQDGILFYGGFHFSIHPLYYIVGNI